MDNEPYDDAPVVPPVAQPKGLRYLLGTWSGRILGINTLVFLVICWLSQSLLLPDMGTLLDMGAKDPVKLVEGQIWRLVTPMFLHVGFIHFAFNSYFLYVVGYQIERLLGGPWFVLVYLLSGIGGNIASAALSVTMSAGASSALFGLLGAGFLLERTIGTRIKKLTGRRPRNRAYAMTLLINLGLGLLIPFIDNSAHIGGLATGCLLTATMMNLRPNNLHAKRPLIGVLLILVTALLFGGGIFCATSKELVHKRLVAAGDNTSKESEKILRYSQALQLQPNDFDARLKRARAFMAEDALNYAFNDLRTIIRYGGHNKDLEQFADELDQAGRPDAAWELRQMLTHEPDLSN